MKDQCDQLANIQPLEKCVLQAVVAEVIAIHIGDMSASRSPKMTTPACAGVVASKK
jgi:hypothetical protein